ncbi:RNA polymerase sigma factor [SAR92 clade bacterium H246]
MKNTRQKQSKFIDEIQINEYVDSRDLEHEGDQLEQPSLPKSYQDTEYINVDDKCDFLNELYRQYWLRLNRSIMALVRNREAAEDIAQDAFMRINRIDDLSSIECYFAYLYRVSVNLIKDQAKANKVRQKYREYLSFAENNGVETLSPERYALGREKLILATKAIEALPPKCRRVFLMHKVYKLSHKEIAKTLGITKNAVERHVIRAMARCRKVLELISEYN